MEASITHDSGSTWVLSIADVTSGADASGPLTYTGPGDSAEWIEELPTMEGAAQPTLANFGSATFTQMASTETDASSVTTTAVDMVDESGNVIARAGPVSDQSFTDTFVPSPHGYWLVGTDGGIFSFGSAQFYGSTGSLHLQRPVVGIVSDD